jgi:hypothetical protein
VNISLVKRHRCWQNVQLSESTALKIYRHTVKVYFMWSLFDNLSSNLSNWFSTFPETLALVRTPIRG